MSRLFPEYVYGAGPRKDCFWDTTCDVPETPDLTESRSADVAIIGAGFTGLNAARTLAKGGASVVVLDAERPGWGASGRNGGFCCLGGGRREDASLDAEFGREERLLWRQTEKAAVEHVAGFLAETGTEADVHSEGETWLAHKSRDVRNLEDDVRLYEENYGVTPTVHAPDDLERLGLRVAGMHGGMTIPAGFALNPRKYLAGLLGSALNAGASVFGAARVERMTRVEGLWEVTAGRHNIRAEQVIVATNGYSSDLLPDWLAGRYLPTQSSIVVTRPMTDNELGAQGWTSHQMSYDSRNLVHYFHLLPDKRMLFGMRGGLRGTEASEERAKARVTRDFHRFFPAWAHVDLTHYWSGMVCLARDGLPFVGQVPGAPGLWCAMAYHGNGVAMGSYCGAVVGDLALGQTDRIYPSALRRPFRRFPLGQWRRALSPPVYLGLMLRDMF